MRLFVKYSKYVNYVMSVCKQFAWVACQRKRFCRTLVRMRKGWLSIPKMSPVIMKFFSYAYNTIQYNIFYFVRYASASHEVK